VITQLCALKYPKRGRCVCFIFEKRERIVGGGQVERESKKRGANLGCGGKENRIEE